MGRGLTDEEREAKRISFIERAKMVHPEENYDYSQVVYVNTHAKVMIVCPIHGSFEQAPVKHLSGQGCPKCVVKKREATCMKHYGVRNPRQSSEIAEKIHNTVLEKYGVDYVVQAVEVREKSVQSYIEHFGYDNPRKAPEVDAKIRRTCLAVYGCENSLGNPEVREKRRNTMLERHGVEYPLQSETIKAAMQNTLLERYGQTNIRGVAEFDEKRRQTCIERYGCDNPFGNKDIQKKIADTNSRLYGVSYPAQNGEIREKQYDAKRENGTFGSSEQEEQLYGLLCNRFGHDDVLRQWSDEKYPFHCDFYVPSRDLYIELNASWTHGGHWFSDADNDIALLSDWKEKAVYSKYYAAAIDTWTVRDVRKRDAAALHNLNYVVFWDEKFKDVMDWFSRGCPDGRDWDCEYSWHK